MRIRYTASVFAKPSPSSLKYAALLGACVLAAYLPSLGNEFVSWDDGSLIVDNPNVRAINAQTLGAIFGGFDPELYVPLTLLSYQIEYALVGANPVLYHMDNLLLHFAASLLVAACAFKITGRRRVAAWTGLLFALHPINVEAVAWASGRKDLLAATFFFAALFVYDPTKPKRYAAALALFVAGAMSKVTAVTLPIVLLSASPRDGKKIDERTMARTAPFFAVAAAFAIVAVIGKQQKIGVLGIWEKFLIACKSTTFTLERIIVPHGFSPVHPYYGEVTITEPFFLSGALLTIAIVAVAVAAYARNKKLHAWCIAFFLITLAPSFANQTKGTSVMITYDRYAYLPFFGIALLLALLFDDARAHLGARRGRLADGIAVAMLVVLAMMTHLQTTVWHSTKTLFTHAANVYPESHVAQEHLAKAAFAEGRFADAARAYEATTIHREDPAAGYVNAGTSYSKLGDDERERGAYEQALTLDPNLPAARYNLARSYEADGMAAEALKHYDLLLESSGDFLDARERREALR